MAGDLERGGLGRGRLCGVDRLERVAVKKLNGPSEREVAATFWLCVAVLGGLIVVCLLLAARRPWLWW